MVEYECKKCGYKTNRKSSYDRHIISVPDCDKIMYEAECEHCQKKITKRKNLNSHLKSCEKYKIHMENSVKLDINGNQNETTINNGDNNVVLNKCPITINIFGNENMEYITEEFVEKLFKSLGGRTVSKLVSAVHLNKEHPENHNFHLTSKASHKYIYYKDQEMWRAKNTKDFIMDIYRRYHDFISNIVEKNPEKFKPEKIKNLEILKDILDGDEWTSGRIELLNEMLMEDLMTFHDDILKLKKQEQKRLNKKT
jgi:hypothetical protein